MMAIVLAFIAALAAVGGGFLALSEKRQLNLTLGFTAGALLGLVAFDLLPEIFEISIAEDLDFLWPMIAFAAGFLLFHTVERYILIHHSHEKDYLIHQHPHVGIASSLTLVGHSFLDGLSIGLAFQINNAVGIAVAIAVIGHRFADGFNSVNLMLLHKNDRARTLKFLGLVGLSPIAGVLCSFLFTLPETTLAIYLGFFAGFIMYIAASDILPQAHSKKSTRATVLLTIAGAIFMFAITRIAE
jgi:ZIP family zinc transporter